MKTHALLLVAIPWLTMLASCGPNPQAHPKPAAVPHVQVVATVNGVPITEGDVNQRSKKGMMGGGPGHEASGNVVQTLVRDELVYQKAVELGLDREPEYSVRLDDLEAQLRAFKRQEMAARFRRYVQEKAAVSDPEARAYFEKNAPFIQSRFHVQQILYKGDRTRILEAHRDLKSGMPFEDVAARRLDVLPATPRPPWDLGELYWHQIPNAWRGVVVRLEPGEVSDVLEGENGRYWIIKLVNKTVDPRMTFETEKERIVEVLRQQKAGELYDSMLAEMTARSAVVFGR